MSELDALAEDSVVGISQGCALEDVALDEAALQISPRQSGYSFPRRPRSSSSVPTHFSPRNFSSDSCSADSSVVSLGSSFARSNCLHSSASLLCSSSTKTKSLVASWVLEFCRPYRSLNWGTKCCSIFSTSGTFSSWFICTSNFASAKRHKSKLKWSSSTCGCQLLTTVRSFLTASTSLSAWEEPVSEHRKDQSCWSRSATTTARLWRLRRVSGWSSPRTSLLTSNTCPSLASASCQSPFAWRVRARLFLHTSVSGWSAPRTLVISSSTSLCISTLSGQWPCVLKTVARLHLIANVSGCSSPRTFLFASSSSLYISSASCHRACWYKELARSFLLTNVSGWSSPTILLLAPSTSLYISSASAHRPSSHRALARLVLLLNVSGWSSPRIFLLASNTSRHISSALRHRPCCNNARAMSCLLPNVSGRSSRTTLLLTSSTVSENSSLLSFMPSALLAPDICEFALAEQSVWTVVVKSENLSSDKETSEKSGPATTTCLIVVWKLENSLLDNVTASWKKANAYVK